MRDTSIRVFDYYNIPPSLSNYKMTDESRKLAADNYSLFLYMFKKYKKMYTIISDSDFDEHIDIFYISYCKQCHTYITKRENKSKLSTYIDVAFRSLCENAIRHYNTKHMRAWRDAGSVMLDKKTDADACIGDVIADNRVDIADHYEKAERLHNVLEFVDNQIQTSPPSMHFTCSGWYILKEWYTNDFTSNTQFLEHLRHQGLAKEDATTEHIRKLLSYYRKKLKGAVERGEI